MCIRPILTVIFMALLPGAALAQSDGAASILSGGTNGSDGSASSKPLASTTSDKTLVGQFSGGKQVLKVVGSDDGKIAVVLSKKPSRIEAFTLPGMRPIGRMVGTYHTIALDKRDRVVAIRRTRMSMFSLKSGARVWSNAIFGRGLSDVQFAGTGNALIVLGDEKGGLSLHRALTGTEYDKKALGRAIKAIRAVPGKQMFAVLQDTGVITGFDIGANNRMTQRWQLKTGERQGVHFDLTSDGKQLLVGFRDGGMKIYDVSGRRADLLREDKKVVARVDSLDLGPKDSEVAVISGGKLHRLPYPGLVARGGPASGAGDLSAATFVGRQGEILSLAGRSVRFHAKTPERVKALQDQGKANAAADKAVIAAFKKRQGEDRAKRREQSNRANTAFKAGDCQAYIAVRKEMGRVISMATCQKMLKDAKLRNEFKERVAALDCDGAAEIARQMGRKFTRELNTCRQNAGNSDKKRFEQAKTNGECDLVAQLWFKVGGRLTDVAKCRAEAVKAQKPAGNARDLFFAAVKKETAKDYQGAMELYQQLMDSFPEDELALDAAKRLVALNDRLAE